MSDKKPEMLVWAEPLERQHLRLLSGDIKRALAWFKEKTREKMETEREARLIMLNPENEHLAKEAGDGVEVVFSGGVLRGEVWLSSEDTFVTPSQRTEPIKVPSKTQPIEILTEKRKMKMSTLNSPSLTVANFRLRGRPTTYKKQKLPEELIKQLGREGMGSKVIASKLKKQGIDVSYRTVHRVLSGERN